MNESEFDPYQSWLGIKNASEGLNHYQLLGLPLFENDAEKIAQAADHQMELVRRHQTGPRGEHTQRLLAEIAKAKTCLQNPESRVAYDDTLIGSVSNATSQVGARSKMAVVISGVALVAIVGWLVGRNLLLDKEIPGDGQDSQESTVIKKNESKEQLGVNGGENIGLKKKSVKQLSNGDVFLGPITASINSPHVKAVKDGRDEYLANWTSANDSVEWIFELTDVKNTYFDGRISYTSASGAKIKIECERLAKTMTLPATDLPRTEEFIVRLTNRKPKLLVLKIIDAGDSPLKIGGVKLTPR